MMGLSVSWVQGFTEVWVAVKELSLGYNNQKTDHFSYIPKIWALTINFLNISPEVESRHRVLWKCWMLRALSSSMRSSVRRNLNHRLTP